MMNMSTNECEKFLILARHGDLENPRGIVYNRDEDMRAEDMMHLNDRGQKQMLALGELIIQQGFRVAKIMVSPEIRARESAKFLTSAGISCEPEFEQDLDDSYLPGLYLEGVTMKELVDLKGDAYSDPRWNRYNHEQPDSIIQRMRRALDKMASTLNCGETGILISHGDSIAWLLNWTINKVKPHPAQLRDAIYPEKGEGYLIVVNKLGTILRSNLLNPQNTGNKY